MVRQSSLQLATHGRLAKLPCVVLLQLDVLVLGEQGLDVQELELELDVLQFVQEPLQVGPLLEPMLRVVELLGHHTLVPMLTYLLFCLLRN